MAYTAPTITGSGITFAQWQKAGTSGHIDLLIGANSFTAAVIKKLKAVKNGQFDRVYRDVAQVIRTYNAGSPVAIADAEQNLKDCHTVFAAMTALCAEAGALMDANAGHLATVANGIGNQKPLRLWP